MPLLISIDEAAKDIRKSRRGIYMLIGSGRLQAVKDGRSTRVVYESLKQYAASLPPANIKPPKWRAEGVTAA